MSLFYTFNNYVKALFQIWCGPSNCLNNSRYVGNVIECSEGQTCVIKTDKICFTPPCVPWGHCEDLRENKDTIPYHVDSNCESNSPQLSNNCAKISLIFDKSKTPAVSSHKKSFHILLFSISLYRLNLLSSIFP